MANSKIYNAPLSQVVSDSRVDPDNSDLHQTVKANDEIPTRSTLEKLEIQLQKQEALITHFSNQIQSSNELLHSSIQDFQSSLQLIFQELKDLKLAKSAKKNEESQIPAPQNHLNPNTSSGIFRSAPVSRIGSMPPNDISLYKKVKMANLDKDLHKKSGMKCWSSTKNICFGRGNMNSADKLCDVVFENHDYGMFGLMLVRNDKTFIAKTIFIFDPGGGAFDVGGGAFDVGTTVKVEFGDKTGAADPVDAHAIIHVANQVVSIAIEAGGREFQLYESDSGIEANDCIKVYLVKSPDEVGETSSLRINPIDLNQFFGEDGKIYGYKNLKINVWMSSVSFQAYADITYEGTFDGGKENTDLKHALQDIFGESLLEKDEFLKTFSAESHYVRSVLTDGRCIDCESSKENNNASNSYGDATGSTTEVIRMELHLMPVGLLYSRIVPLILLLVEGGSPVDVSDPSWDIYFVVKKSSNQVGEYNVDLLGFSTVYRFFHYPDGTRFRVGQILVLPQYQGQGHGRRLLDSIYSTAISENAYDITFEEPSEYLQSLRTCNDTVRLLNFEPIKPSINSVVQYLKENDLSKKTAKANTKSHFAPPVHVTNVVRQKLKINRKQFVKCWYVLIYLNLDIKNQRCVDNFNACVFDRVKSEILAKDSDAKGRCLTEVPNDYGHDMTFVVMSSDDGEAEKVQEEQGDREEQLNQLIQKQIDDIVVIASKVSSIKQ